MSRMDKIIAIAKRRGFVFPSSEIYGGVAGFYDLGPLGVKMRRKIEDFWRERFFEGLDIYEVSSRLITPEVVFKASGHVESFTDPFTSCRKCKSFFRADHLIEERTGKFVEGWTHEQLTQELRRSDLRCPKCNSELSDVEPFPLMFRLEIGRGAIGYLRPETAQGIFINFKNVANAMRARLPFGIAQVGISFRNEISPRQYLIRLREFVQFEIEYFINPRKLGSKEYAVFDQLNDVRIRLLTREAQLKGGEEIELTVKEAVEKGIVPNKVMGYFLAREFLWFQELGIPKDALRFRHMLPEETPFYSKGNFDLEILTEYGWKESVGNAYRTDYDLRQHMKLSKKDLRIEDDGEKLIAHVVEPSFGFERPLVGIFYHCFVEDKERGWDWFRFNPRIAPFLAGIFPLVSKDGLPERARQVYEALRRDFDVFYDEKGSIGKRYARSDEIGTPVAITIDYQTLKDGTVTLRDRDTTMQARVAIKDLIPILREAARGKDVKSLIKGK